MPAEEPGYSYYLYFRQNRRGNGGAGGLDCEAGKGLERRMKGEIYGG